MCIRWEYFLLKKYYDNVSRRINHKSNELINVIIRLKLSFRIR